MNMGVRWLNLEYIFNWLYEFIFGRGFEAVPGFLTSLIFWFKLLALALAPVTIVALIILSIKIVRLRWRETGDMRISLFARYQTSPLKNERWERVLERLAAENPAEWKLAVIEADNMLDDVVKQLRTIGENLGERLKSIEPSDFLTLDDAWEAHKVRNRIAHESDFNLTKPQARDTIARYKRVFEEFEYI